MKTSPQVPVPAGYNLRDIQLEMSLKPFYDNGPATREAVCRELFTQWQGLWRHAEQVSILLWVAEGSEMLEYDGNLETTFEWARYHGAPNKHRWKVSQKGRSKNADHSAIGTDMAKNDPEGKGIHSRAYLYRPEPAAFTYGWLKELVADLKRIGEAITGLPVMVGQAFDIGPEFAVSRFKFDWHREILGDGQIFREQFISCEAVLKGDERTYAAYPDGIPEGTTIGEFLGRQIRAMFDDCGHDFLWLSNGFGFSLEPWALVGKVFDGAAFHPEVVEDTRRRIMRFWTSMREAIGKEVNLRTRGTNLATGIDIGSDASPLKQIYEENPQVDAPVNSPWAALDSDFGLEMSGWMSHIAVHPGDTFRFRFYIHDPWWLNSPWLDRYERNPHDLYLPLSISRLREDGSVGLPRDLAFLSVDDSHGRMPLQVPNEVTAFFLRARETAPDAPGPHVWVYPFDEFHKLGLEQGCPERPLHADAWIGTVINAGVPLNTVADASILESALTAKPELVEGRIFWAAVPQPGSAYEAVIRKLQSLGADLLLYGPLFEGSYLWDELGLSPSSPLEGDFELPDDLTEEKVRHTGFLSAGGWCESAADIDDGMPTIRARQGAEDRVAFRLCTTKAGGKVGWLRASLSTGEYEPEDPQPILGPILRPLDAGLLAPGRLAREVLSHFGWQIEHRLADGDPKAPYLTVHQHKNAFILSGYHRNECSSQTIRHAFGAPLLTGRHNRIEKGSTSLDGQIAWKAELRMFAQTEDTRIIVCRELVPAMHGIHRRILLSGLDETSLVILPDPDHVDTLRLLPDPKFPYFVGEPIPVSVEKELGLTVVRTEPVSGELLIEW